MPKTTREIWCKGKDGIKWYSEEEYERLRIELQYLKCPKCNEIVKCVPEKVCTKEELVTTIDDVKLHHGDCIQLKELIRKLGLKMK